MTVLSIVVQITSFSSVSSFLLDFNCVWDMKLCNAGSLILLSCDHLLPRLADNKEKSGSANL